MKSDKKLRIAFITNTYLPEQSGIISSILASVQALKSIGHECFVITLDTFRQKELRFTDPSYVFRVSCQIYFTHREKRVAIPLSPQLRLEQLFDQLKPDIIHCWHPFLLSKAALSVARRKKIPCVFTYSPPFEHYNYFLDCPPFIGKYIATRQAIDFCNSVDGIIAPTAAVKDHIKKMGVEKEVVVIPTCLQPSFIHEHRPFKNKLAGEPFKLFVVGRMIRENNVQFVLDVFRLLPPGGFKLIIAGSGDYFTRLQAYAYKRLCLPVSQVSFYSGYRSTELIPLYKEADLLLFPTKTDQQSIVIMESFGCGTPVIALESNGPRDAIRNGMNGFFVRTQQEMAEVIIQIKKDRELQDLLQEYAWRTSRLYMADVMSEKLIHFYMGLCFQREKE